MSLRFARLAVAFLALLPALPARAGSELLAMRVEMPADAAIADVTTYAGETSDLCGPGEQLRRDGGRWVCESRGGMIASSADTVTYQTFEIGSARPGAATRFAAACLGSEDRVLAGSCVRRAADGYVSFAGRLTHAHGSNAIECDLDGAESASAVGIALCLDVPPLR